MTTERLDDLIALAALGELSDDEQRELDAAVRDDPRAADDLAQALAAAAAVQATTAEAPPTALREDVLAAIRATPQEPSSPEHAPTASVRVDEVVVPIDAERRRRRWMTPVLGAAAAIVLVVGGFVLVNNDTTTPDEITAVVNAPDAQARTLVGELVGITVVYSAAEQALVVDGSDLDTLSDTETYQLWLVDGAGATSVGTFRPDAGGDVAERFDDVDPIGVILGVTKEPAGGSTTPTLPILAAA